MFPLFDRFPFIKKDGTRTTLGDAISQGGGQYVLPTASATTKGGVKIGDGVQVSDETLSLKKASDEQLGGVKVGTGLSIDEDGVLTASGGGGSIICKRGTQNFTLGENGWNSFSVTFGSDFADTNYTWLYSITITGSQSTSSMVPINVLVKTKNVGSISGRIYNANNEVITGIVEWVAIHL